MLAIAIVLILIVVGGVLPFVKQGEAAKKLALCALSITFVFSLILLRVVSIEQIHIIAGAEPWNFYLMVTPLNALMACLFTGLGAFIVWASFSIIEREVLTERVPGYYALVCVLIATLCGTVFMGNLINTFVMIELSSFAAVGIVIIKKCGHSLRAGIKYLTLSLLGSTFILMSIVIVHQLTGSLSLSGIFAGISEGFVGNEYQIRSALIFFTVGSALKSALFPLHIWLPDAHANAPVPSSALLSALVPKAYIFNYLFVLRHAFGEQILLGDHIMHTIMFVIMVSGAVAMLAGSIFALFQHNLKRMIAYSTVAQIGYMFLGIGLGSDLGLLAVILNIIVHAVAKSMLFLSAGLFIADTGSYNISDLTGVGRRNMFGGAAFTAGALSMMGIPVFAGFVAKFYLANAAALYGGITLWIVLPAIVVSTFLNGLYYFPVIISIFSADPGTADAHIQQSPVAFSLKASLVIMFVINIGLGLLFMPLFNTFEVSFSGLLL